MTDNARIKRRMAHPPYSKSCVDCSWKPQSVQTHCREATGNFERVDSRQTLRRDRDPNHLHIHIAPAKAFENTVRYCDNMRDGKPGTFPGRMSFACVETQSPASGCCARATRGHAAAPPTSASLWDMTPLLIWDMSQCPTKMRCNLRDFPNSRGEVGQGIGSQGSRRSAEGEGQMTGGKKSTDPGLSNAEHIPGTAGHVYAAHMEAA